MHEKIKRIEEKYIAESKQRIKETENPFLKKAHRKTVLGTILQAGLKELDKKISKSVKHKTAKNNLSV